MFWADGLNFECQKCLHCCSGEPGFVYLSEKDIKNASQELKISENEFISKYCRYIDFGSYYLISLKERDNYDCIFLSKDGCKIYSSRPEQCRTYPFWEHLMKDKSEFNKEKKECPGIGKGRKVSKDEIELALIKMRNNQYYKVKK